MNQKKIGGLIGISSNVQIDKSCFVGEIEGNNSIVAGIIADSNNSIISNSFVYSTLESNNAVAGFIGDMTSSKILTSYSISELNAPLKAGLALIRTRVLNEVVDSYFDSNISGISEPQEQARTTSQLKNPQTYLSWNIVWYFDTIFLFPILQNIKDEVVDEIKNFVNEIYEKANSPKTNPIHVTIITDSSNRMTIEEKKVLDSTAKEITNKLFSYGNQMKIGLLDFNYNNRWIVPMTDSKDDINIGLENISRHPLQSDPWMYDAIIKGINGYLLNTTSSIENDNILDLTYENNIETYSNYFNDDIDRHIIILSQGTTTDKFLNGINKVDFIIRNANKYGINIHFVRINSKNQEMPIDLKNLTDGTNGILYDIKAGNNIDSRNEIKKAAINIDNRITGRVDKFRGLLLYTGLHWKEEYPNYEEDLLNKIIYETPINNFIINSSAEIFRFYRDNNNIKEIFGLEDILNIKITDANPYPNEYESGSNPLSDNLLEKYNRSYISQFNESKAVLYFRYTQNDIQKKYLVGYSESEADEPYLINQTNKSYYTGDALQTYSYYLEDQFLEHTINLAEKIWNIDENAQIWFTLPSFEIINLLADKYIEPFKIMIDKYETRIRALGNEKWINNIKGFYFGQESITSYENRNRNILDSTKEINKIYKNFKVLSEYIRNKDKKVLWIPHYDVPRIDIGEAQYKLYLYDKVLGELVNKTNTLDYAIFQPSYYFGERKKNLEFIREILLKSAALYYPAPGESPNVYNNIVGNEKISDIQLGFELELDGTIVTDPEELKSIKKKAEDDKMDGDMAVEERKEKLRAHRRRLGEYVNTYRDMLFSQNYIIYSGDAIELRACINEILSITNEGVLNDYTIPDIE